MKKEYKSEIKNNNPKFNFLFNKINKNYSLIKSDKKNNINNKINSNLKTYNPKLEYLQKMQNCKNKINS